DLLQGRGGDDTLDGGDGIDQAVYSGPRGDYFVSFDATTGTYVVDDLRQGSPDGTDQVQNVETFVFADGAISAGSVLDGNPGPIIGDDGDNTLTGTPIADVIRGLGGNDTLSGLAGEDFLDGGPGNDTLDGGTGSDTASYASATRGVTVSLAVTGPQDTGGAGVDTLVSIENLTGSAFDDTLIGNAGDNALRGGAGNDILIGGAGADAFDGGDGFDLVSYETNTLVVPLLNLTPIDFSGSSGVGGDATGDTFANIEGVIGSPNNDLITGRLGVADAIFGGAGNDIIDGQGGGDTINGGVGNDLLFGLYGNNHFVGGGGGETRFFNGGATHTHRTPPHPSRPS